MKEKITPVLLGADLNCYNVARAFVHIGIKALYIRFIGGKSYARCLCKNLT